MNDDINNESDLTDVDMFHEIKRFWASRFDNENTIDKYDVQKSDIYKNDPRSKIRGKWNNRLDFLFGCIGSVVGLGNFCIFPSRVHNNGGSAFILLYIFMSLIMGLPILILEFGLGQFTSYSSVMAFNLVPLFSGIGFMQYIIIGIVCIYYSIITSWIYFYVGVSFTKTLPWIYCDNSFNSDNCRSILDNLNLSDKYVRSSEEYFFRYVLGYEKLDGTTMDFNELGNPLLHLVISLAVVWLITVGIIIFGFKIISRIYYVAVLFPLLLILALMVFSLTLSGSAEGMSQFIHFNKTKYIEPNIYLEASTHLSFSLCIGIGILISYGSFNDFHDNFYRDSLIIIIVDFLFNILCCIIAFSFVGHVSYNTGKSFDFIFRSGLQSIFIIYTDIFANMSGGHFWNIIILIVSAFLGMTSHISCYHTFITCSLDKFKICRSSLNHKSVTIISWAIIFYLLSLLFVTPGGYNWLKALDESVLTLSYLLSALCECLIIGGFYGLLYFRYDLRVMMGYSISTVWLILFSVPCPLILTIIIIINVPSSIKMNINNKIPPDWFQALFRLLLFLVISPVFYSIISTLFYYRGYIKTDEYWKKLLEPPINYGPYYKSNWLKSNDYIMKMLENKDEILVNKTNNIENLEEIILIAHKIHEKAIHFEIIHITQRFKEYETKKEIEPPMKSIEEVIGLSTALSSTLSSKIDIELVIDK